MGFSNLMVAAAAAWLITFAASRGRHSQIHHHIAWIALRLEVLLLVCGLLGWQTLGSIILLAVGGCFLAVFVTDNYIPDAYQNVRHLLIHREWVRAGRD